MDKDKHQWILALVERMAGEACLTKLSNKTSVITCNAITKLIRIEADRFSTAIIFNNGTEFYCGVPEEPPFPFFK